MNIEIANRLQQLRKKNGLSQEELAARIGVSRQAVSKWERAEASPDTDNLVLLSQLYGISLDELLKTGSIHLPDRGVSLKKEAYVHNGANVPEMFPENYTDEEIYPQGDPAGRISAPGSSSPENGAAPDIKPADRSAGRKSADFGSKYEKVMYKFETGLEDKMDRLGTKIEKGMDKLSDSMDNFQSGTNTGKKGLSLFDKTLPLMIGAAFALMTMIGLAHPGWTLFLLIPLYYTFVSAVRKKNPMIFCYPVLCAFVYFSIGGICDQIFRSWSDNWYGLMWLIFLTIPLYYTGYFAVKKRNPLIFCYPVLALMFYIGIGIFLSFFSWHIADRWFAAAWIPFLISIPFYYIVISHFRNKRKQAEMKQNVC